MTKKSLFVGLLMLIAACSKQANSPGNTELRFPPPSDDGVFNRTIVTASESKITKFLHTTVWTNFASSSSFNFDTTHVFKCVSDANGNIVYGLKGNSGYKCVWVYVGSGNTYCSYYVTRNPNDSTINIKCIEGGVNNTYSYALSGGTPGPPPTCDNNSINDCCWCIFQDMISCWWTALTCSSDEDITAICLGSIALHCALFATGLQYDPGNGQTLQQFYGGSGSGLTQYHYSSSQHIVTAN